MAKTRALLFYVLLLICSAGADKLTKITLSPSSACQAGMKAATPKIQNILSGIQSSLLAEKSGGRLKAVLEDCQETIGQSLTYLNSSINRMQFYSTKSLKDGTSDDIWTWMSSTLTDHATCVEELQSLGASCPQELLKSAHELQNELASALSLFTTARTHTIQQSLHNRKLLSLDHGHLPYPLDHDGLPSWMPTEQRRRLLQTTSADIVVALDGSGKFKSVQAAVDAASSGNVIYVKSGTYYETVTVPKSKTNLVILGDGIGKTIISASKYYAQVGTTFKTPTVAIKASGFIGKYLTIQNTAGASKNQAVALLVTSDKVAFYKCAILAYQDTLYTYTNRQFYRECQIQGTVDFVFGNAAAVLQSCTIYARSGGNTNTITAQGRTDKNQNTGLSFQSCQVDGAISATYLGRPWKDYSRTVFMECQLSSAINPAGWLEWSGASYRSKTVYYGEYQNTGAGASRSGRVSWSKALSMDEASQFTVGNFIGGSWLSVPYDAGL